MTTLTINIGEIYMTFDGETAAEVVELYRGYREVAGEPTINNYWVDWNSGECPVPADSRVEYIMRSGSRSEHGERAGDLIWIHNGSIVDIVAYRPVPA